MGCKMGCINNIKIKQRKYPYIMMTKTNLRLVELNNSKNTEIHSEKIYTKKDLTQFQDIPPKNDDNWLDYNPLPFVKIKRKKKLSQQTLS